MDRRDSLKAQYAGAGNFNARVRLGARFGTNPYPWNRWVFDRLRFPSGARVLELGCGPAYLWAQNLARVPLDASILLTDFSKGMLVEAKKTLGVMAGFFNYAGVDAEQIPYGGGSFDAVIANHMLYHVPDRKKALGEIRRVLKSDGVFYATTIGRGNLQEMRELFRACFSLSEHPVRTVADRFGLENGEEQLREFFGDVSLERYENSLQVTEAGPMIDYILSVRSADGDHPFFTPERRKQFEDFIKQIVDTAGPVRVTKESGLFVAKGYR